MNRIHLVSINDTPQTTCYATRRKLKPNDNIIYKGGFYQIKEMTDNSLNLIDAKRKRYAGRNSD
jgi:hypothetical protein